MAEPGVPYFDLKAQYRALEREILAALERVCRNATFASGPEVEAFEQAFAAYCETAFCVGVNSGTSALHLALRSLDIGRGDEVITTPYTFIATAWAVTYTGATPVFVDVHPATRTLDPAGLEARITARTRAVLPVHLYGLPADMDAIQPLADAAGIAVVEDAAQAHGARYRGRRVGGLGRLAGFSFYPGKNLGAYGEGGAITTDDPALAARCRRLRDHAQSRRYYHDEVGYNYRMDGFQGAVLQVKLAHLDAWNRRRAALAARYTAGLAGLPLRLPSVPEGTQSAWHLYVVEAERRDALRAYLETEHRIATAMHYPVCLHQQAPYRHLGHRTGDFPVAEALAAACVSLPFFPEMTDTELDTVVAAIRRFYAG
ncbi:MAG: DegT/DnrJ/EryC1/StrS family aminotransferase [Planctomycetes bacterium]|nr:DegT/DnrJ/EryC1/StrS family aminotransferase [Planctomycetota bacterium]